MHEHPYVEKYRQTDIHLLWLNIGTSMLEDTHRQKNYSDTRISQLMLSTGIRR